MKSNNSTGRFQKTIGLPQVVALNIGAVLGSGILLVPGIAADIAGPASLLAWGLMSLLVLPMALVMGLLSAKFPNAGGVSHFVSKAFGPKAGALVGWFFLMSVPIGAPVIAITGSGYLSMAMGWDETLRLTIAASILVIGLGMNYFGMKIAGQLQVAVVTSIIGVLLLVIFGAIPKVESVNFVIFMPNGWLSVGQAAAILFWCFIGWEAISHLSEEFIDPEREAIRGVTISAIIVGVIYFLTAFATIGTHSYGSVGSEVSLVLIIDKVFGTWGAVLIGFTGIFICMATAIAYIGAASRLAYSLASNGYAPKVFGVLSKKFGTPLGGLGFLTMFFIVILTVYGSGIVSLVTLIQFPNATFILTYLGGCLAGIKLLKQNKWGLRISWLSFLLTAIVFPFVGWVVVYPLIIFGVFFLATKLMTKKIVQLDTDIQDVS
jgi:amino acid efflux transporter